MTLLAFVGRVTGRSSLLVMSVLRRLRTTRDVEAVPFPAAPAPTTDNLFEAVYGKPDPEAQPRRDRGLEYLTPAEAERRLSRPLSDAQLAGIAAEIAIQEQR